MKMVTRQLQTIDQVPRPCGSGTQPWMMVLLLALAIPVHSANKTNIDTIVIATGPFADKAVAKQCLAPERRNAFTWWIAKWVYMYKEDCRIALTAKV